MPFLIAFKTADRNMELSSKMDKHTHTQKQRAFFYILYSNYKYKCCYSNMSINQMMEKKTPLFHIINISFSS